MKQLAEQTLYEILEVPPDAPPPAIASAIDRALALYGPGSLVTYSLVSTEEASLLVGRIDEAREILLDPDARARYDETLVGGRGEARGGANGRRAPALLERPVLTPVPAAPSPVPVVPILLSREVPQAPAASLAAQRTSVTPLPAPADARREPRPEAAPPAASDRASGGGATPTPLPRVSPAGAGPAAPVATPPPVAPPAPLAAPSAAPPTPSLDTTTWSGEVLRQIREARGITIPQLSERTKVTRHHIENIEADHFGRLPAPVYLRGILLSLARELRLDGQKVARSYLERAAAAVGGGAGKR